MIGGQEYERNNNKRTEEWTMKYFVSTLNFSSFRRRKLSVVLPEMIRSGIKNIEVASLHPFEEGLDRIILGNSKNVNILLHNFVPTSSDEFLLDLSGTGETKKSMELVKSRMLLTKKLGNDYYSFHAGFRVKYVIGEHLYKERRNWEETTDSFIMNLNEILKFAEELDVHIGVENHAAIYESRDNLILYDINDWTNIFNRVKSKYFHLHLDIGHLKLCAREYDFDPYEFIYKFADKVMMVHVHDNTGYKIDCHTPFGDDFWMTKHQWHRFKKMKYVSLETKSLGNTELINSMVQKLKRDIE